MVSHFGYLPDGRVNVVSGFDDLGSYNYLDEVYNPVSKSWSISYDPFRTNSYCIGFDSTCSGVAHHVLEALIKVLHPGLRYFQG